MPATDLLARAKAHGGAGGHRLLGDLKSGGCRSTTWKRFGSGGRSETSRRSQMALQRGVPGGLQHRIGHGGDRKKPAMLAEAKSCTSGWRRRWVARVLWALDSATGCVAIPLTWSRLSLLRAERRAVRATGDVFQLGLGVADGGESSSSWAHRGRGRIWLRPWRSSPGQRRVGAHRAHFRRRGSCDRIGLLDAALRLDGATSTCALERGQYRRLPQPREGAVGCDSSRDGKPSPAAL